MFQNYREYALNSVSTRNAESNEILIMLKSMYYTTYHNFPNQAWRNANNTTLINKETTGGLIIILTRQITEQTTNPE